MIIYCRLMGLKYPKGAKTMKKTLSIELLRSLGYTQLVWDGCHKIYLIKSEDEVKEAILEGYDSEDIKPLEKLEITYWRSCSLRFISSWDLKTRFIDQFEKVSFEQ